uniref:Uncharacterized protein n=1 Tax=Physcomitrium patens TaxID=3218 RepID=A0A2K1J409_PHYPA|nr:hypothetical protein PHYPA_022112 [Physcomitrium patens]
MACLCATPTQPLSRIHLGEGGADAEMSAILVLAPNPKEKGSSSVIPDEQLRHGNVHKQHIQTLHMLFCGLVPVMYKVERVGFGGCRSKSSASN